MKERSLQWLFSPERLPLDHLVLGVPDLEEGVANFARRTRLSPVFGGRHPTGTADYLVKLGSSAYLEILGLMPDARVGLIQRWHRARHATAPADVVHQHFGHRRRHHAHQ